MSTSNPGGKVGIEPYYNNQEIQWEEPAKFYAGCVGPGWVPLLLELTGKLFFLGWDGKLAQVKEKFGTLRFYFANNIPGIAGEIAWDLVAHAEMLSEQTCEACGGYGKLRGVGWLKTRCDECWEKEQK